MNNMDKRIFYIWLAECSEAQSDRKLFLMSLFGDAEGVYNASPSDLRDAFAAHPQELPEQFLLEALLRKDLRPAERSLRQAEACGAEAICLEDSLYPPHLAEISDPPPVIYALGNTDLLKE